MPALARLIALGAAAAVVTGCADRAAPEPPRGAGLAGEPGPDGLVAALGRASLTCMPDGARQARLVTPAYRALRPTPDGVRAFARAIGQPPPDRARVLYADDLEVPAALRRARPMLPVGRPPLVAFAGARALPALFVHDAGRWFCLIDPDGAVRARLADPACAAAYARSTTGRCLDLTAPIATAALDGDPAALTRRCALLVQQGCDSVPAEAPP